jgi:hypothetical protein
MPAYQLPQAQLHVCGSTATLKSIFVQTRELGVEPQGHVFGNIGYGLLNQFHSYTIDFRHMQCRVGDRLRQTRRVRRKAAHIGTITGVNAAGGRNNAVVAGWMDSAGPMRYLTSEESTACYFPFGSPGVFGMQRWFGLGHAPSQPVSRRVSASISRSDA